MMPPELLAGWSALLALGATIIGAVTLGLFFARGGAWGKLNDAASVVLLLAMIPVALVVARIEADAAGIASVAVAALGIGAMVVVGVLQALLVADRVTYEQTKAAVLGGGALVGAWYVLVGLFGAGTALDGAMRWLAIGAGLGYIAIGYGFMAGNERHPLSVGGGLLLLVASCLFLGLLGVGLVSDQIAVPA